jgi:hypothetical protein
MIRAAKGFDDGTVVFFHDILVFYSMVATFAE